jgi:predicted transcriptional regulator
VDRELAIIEGIERGLADVEAGRTVSHEDAMATVRQAIKVAAGGTA